MSGGHSSLGACVVGGHAWQGGVHAKHAPPSPAWYYEIRSVNERAVHILLECILVSFLFRFCVCFVMFSTILRAFLGTGEVAGYNTSWILGVIYTLSAIFNVWNILYFLEMLPWFSILALSIQRMFGKMLRFLTVFCLLFFSFEYTFFRLYNDRGVCTEGFTGWLDSFYSTFLIMVNMVNVSEVVGGIDILLCTHPCDLCLCCCYFALEFPDCFDVWCHDKGDEQGWYSCSNGTVVSSSVSRGKDWSSFSYFILQKTAPVL